MTERPTAGKLDRRGVLLLLPLVAAGIACRRKAAETSQVGASNPLKKNEDIPPALPPAAADEIEFSYAIELSAGHQRVPANHEFRSGDLFRIFAKPGFEANFYLFNRSSAEDQVHRLFPDPALTAHNPLAANSEILIPDKTSFKFDAQAGTENLVVVVATMPVAEINEIGPDMSRAKFDRIMARLEQDHRPKSIRQFEDGDLTKVIASPSKQIAVTLYLPLRHT